MSTEHQQYSTSNQRDVIREYAGKRGFQIVRTYADDGKSGLRLQGREALQQLIRDVESGRTDFEAILVYDISRWGRFQDTDESAYYEYICKRAGIRVVYCAEQFENDGSPVSTIIKGVKRAMAGEYSRELSTKVFQGQCRLIQLGFRQGGPAGFGLRRMLVGSDGQPKGTLRRGEQKSLQTDRVVLVPGPTEEVEIVRRIYQFFVHEGWREAEIAAWLNQHGVSSETGQPWSRAMVRQILTNEKYIGHNVYNRVSFKLKKKRVRNLPEMWIRAEDAFKPVVDASVFYTACGIMHERVRVFSNEQMIEGLRTLLEDHGRLSSELIDQSETVPGSGAYRSRFGSLVAAYRLAGYEPGRDYGFLEVNRRLRQVYPRLVAETIGQLEAAGASVQEDQTRNQLLINGELSAAMVMTRCRQTPAGSLRWQITLDRPAPPDLTIVVRMDALNERPVDFYLLPLLDLHLGSLRLHEDNGVALDTYRFESLHYLVRLSARTRIEVAA